MIFDEMEDERPGRRPHRGFRFTIPRGIRAARFGDGDFHIDFGDDFPFNFGTRSAGRGGGGPRGPRGRKRMFESGELRLVLLRMIADEPRHGYELIKAIEDLTGGDYAPSPGIVYPTLSMLEDIGFIDEADSPDSKRTFEATDAGRAHLDENADEVEGLMDRLSGMGRRKEKREQRPEVGRAVGNLMHAIRNRIGRDGWNEELFDELVDVLDEAAKRIERGRSAT
jgi:DNA-binding PadR family transcriptional regulator